MTESVNCVLACPPYNTCLESSHENGFYDKFTDNEMEVFAGVLNKVWVCGRKESYYAPTDSSVDCINCFLRSRRNTTNLVRWMRAATR